MSDDLNPWWSHLAHNGVLVSPIVLADWFPKGVPVVADYKMDQLRKAYFQFKDDPNELRSWLDALLEKFLGHTALGVWRKEQNIPDRFKQQGQKPNRVLLHGSQEHRPRLAVFIDDERVTKSDGAPYRLGRHGGRRTYARMLRLMRQIDVPLGIFTNGHYVRLVYAGLDHDAWAEWDCSSWFLGREGRETLHGLNAMLSRSTLDPAPDAPHNPLLDRIKESREKQADLSHVMGTQVREAVEILLEELTDTLAADPAEAGDIMAPLDKVGSSEDERLQALYQASIRHIMRLVVVLYAESRNLLPKDEVLYYDSYSVEGLYQQLKEAVLDGHEENLRDLESAWPRLLGLFRLIHDGSDHKDLRIFAYGGQLFRPASSDTHDTVMAALAVFADPRVHVSDWAIYQILDKLRVGKYKIGHGRWRSGPVDFSDLRTEFIGMMYEGLLDYDLRRGRPEDEGIVFLNIGDQPALPLSLLKSQSDADLKKLLRDQGKYKSAAETPDEEPDEVEVEEAAAHGEEVLGAVARDSQVEEQDAHEAFLADVHAWARKAVKLGQLFGCTPAKLKKLDKPEQDKLIGKAAAQLVLRSVPVGGMYLVRWSGTRKGSGTFYTKPGLAVPTTIRTLEPLAYENHEDPENRQPKSPDAILELKVCDPAMGSGSFLVAALRFLTQALKESWDQHVQPRIDAGEKVTVRGEPAIGLLAERIMEARKSHEADELIEASLRRLVVEHCIYGVDLNPLAVELGKLSLWIETLDPKLSFAFLDHKIKCGNSLIGAWRHQADIYPLAAWDRQFGDGAKNLRTKRAARIRKEIILPELNSWLDGWKISHVPGKKRKLRYKQVDNQAGLFGGKAKKIQVVTTEVKTGIERVGTQATLEVPSEDVPWEEFREHELLALDKIHEDFDPATKEQEYRRLILDSPAHQYQKYLLDKWCAVWFWPVTEDENAPLDAEPILGPREFYQKQSESVRQTVVAISSKYRFLHWELEFPEVFGEERFGFDAVVGNPPWETAKPQDNEFFTKYDPGYRALGKQEGLKRQNALFDANPAILSELWDYQEWYKAQSNYVRSCNDLSASKPGGKASDQKWKALAADTKIHPSGMITPYTYQGGGDLNLYKMFIEKFVAISSKLGRQGFLAPCGVYLDRGCGPLRQLLINEGSIERIIQFINRKKIFAIPSQHKFACYITSREPGRPLVAKFLAVDEMEWHRSLDDTWVRLTRDDIRRLSPNHGVVYELPTNRDLRLSVKLMKQSVMASGFGLRFGTEFHTTNDSNKAISVQRISLRPNRHDSALLVDDDAEQYLPIWIGRMIHAYRSNLQGFIKEGEKWSWRENSAGESVVRPDKAMLRSTYETDSKAIRNLKIGFRRTTQPIINPRSMLASLLPDAPSMDSLHLFTTEAGQTRALAAVAVLNSYVYDYVIRFRVPSLNLNSFIVTEAPFPDPEHEGIDELALEASRLVCIPGLVPSMPSRIGSVPNSFAEDPAERALIMESIDSGVARTFNLDDNDMRWILRPDNSDPRNLWRDYRERLKVLEGAGHRGKWYTLDEAREIRRKAGMEVNF